MRDYPEHILNDSNLNCWCGPSIETVEDAGFVVIHNDWIGMRLNLRSRHYDFYTDGSTLVNEGSL